MHYSRWSIRMFRGTWIPSLSQLIWWNNFRLVPGKRLVDLSHLRNSNITLEFRRAQAAKPFFLASLNPKSESHARFYRSKILKENFGSCFDWSVLSIRNEYLHVLPSSSKYYSLLFSVHDPVSISVSDPLSINKLPPARSGGIVTGPRNSSVVAAFGGLVGPRDFRSQIGPLSSHSCPW